MSQKQMQNEMAKIFASKKNPPAIQLLLKTTTSSSQLSLVGPSILESHGTYHYHHQGQGSFGGIVGMDVSSVKTSLVRIQGLVKTSSSSQKNPRITPPENADFSKFQRNKNS